MARKNCEMGKSRREILPCASWWQILAALACLFLLPCLPLRAQTANGRITGTVTDAQGAAIPNAQVTVTDLGTGVATSAVTDSHGVYHALDLPIGNYEVTVKYPGFASTTTSAETLNINQTLLINVQMKVGSVTQSVTVSANAAQVETQIPTVGGTVTGATIQNLPLNGRNVLQLATTQPGVATLPNGQTGFSIAGGASNSVLYMLDGGIDNSVTSNNVVFNPNPDTVAEFRVLENNYTAEYGKNGGGVVSMVTKSGTNTWHGSAFDYLRNNDMDANLFFNKEQPALGNPALPRPILKRNQFGGTLGGPVLKDKLFFFFGYEGQRQTQSQTGQLINVYTPAELTGDFSQANGGSPDPSVVAFLQANPYFQSDPAKAAQGIIDPNSIDPVAKSYIAAGLIPSTPTGTLQPTGAPLSNFDQYTGRFDYYLSKIDRLALDLSEQRSPTTNPLSFNGNNGNGGTADVPGYGSTNMDIEKAFNLSWTRTISPAKLNVARVVVERHYANSAPASHPPSGSTLGVNIKSDAYFAPPQVSWDSAGMQIGFNPNVPNIKADTTFAYSDMFTWIRGNNTWNFGGSFTAVRERSTYTYQTNGAFEFYGGGTGTGSGNDLADFLFGVPDLFYESAKGVNGEEQKEYTAFAEDAWQVRKNLTLTIGLRYEYYSPETDPAGLSFSYIPGLTSQRFTYAPPGFVVPGDKGAPKGWYWPDWLDFAPRLGFAWDVTGDGKTSVRGGFGVFYDSLNGWMADWDDDVPPYWGSSYLTYLAPNSCTGGTVNCGYTSAPGIMTDPYGAAGATDPFPSTPPPSTLDFPNLYDPFSQSVWFVNPNLKTPYIFQYNLSIERQLAPNLMAEIGYLGSSTHKEIAWAAENSIDPKSIVCSRTDSSTGACTQLSGQRVINEGLTAAENAAPPVPHSCNGFCYSPLTVFDGLVHANYNALVASLTKRTGNVKYLGSTFFSASYTWSHNLSNGAANSSSGVPLLPSADPNALYGNASIDQAQRFVLSGGWTLPFDQYWQKGKRIVGGWTLFPIFEMQSGAPIDMSAGLGVSQSGPGPSGYGDQGAERPDVFSKGYQTFDPHTIQTITSGAGRSITGNLYFNPAAYGLDPCIVSSSYDTCKLGFYGTYRPNSFMGPGLVNLDMALEKQFPITERLNMAFRAEAFNIFNHAEFENPGSTRVSSSSFGVISQTLPQRILQVALRLDF